MENRLTSIIIPTFNRSALIKKAIQSCLQQTFQDIEVIVVDDASTEDIKQVTEAFRDGRIKYFRLPRNAGPSAARNAGLEVSRGEFITFLDSDDQYKPDKIASQIELFQTDEQKTLGVVSCGREDYDSKGRLYHSWTPTLEGNILAPAFSGRKIGAGTPFLMVRREAVAADVRFDENINIAEDFDFVVQILMKGYQFGIVKQPLVKVYHNEIERAFKYDEAAEARKYLWGKYESYLQQNATMARSFIFKSLIYAHQGRNKGAFQFFSRQLAQFDDHRLRKLLWRWLKYAPVRSKLGNAYLKFLKKTA